MSIGTYGYGAALYFTDHCILVQPFVSQAQNGNIRIKPDMVHRVACELLFDKKINLKYYLSFVVSYKFIYTSNLTISECVSVDRPCTRRVRT